MKKLTIFFSIFFAYLAQISSAQSCATQITACQNQTGSCGNLLTATQACIQQCNDAAGKPLTNFTFANSTDSSLPNATIPQTCIFNCLATGGNLTSMGNSTALGNTNQTMNSTNSTNSTTTTGNTTLIGNSTTLPSDLLYNNVITCYVTQAYPFIQTNITSRLTQNPTCQSLLTTCVSIFLCQYQEVLITPCMDTCAGGADNNTIISCKLNCQLANGNDPNYINLSECLAAPGQTQCIQPTVDCYLQLVCLQSSQVFNNQFNACNTTDNLCQLKSIDQFSNSSSVLQNYISCTRSTAISTIQTKQNSQLTTYGQVCSTQAATCQTDFSCLTGSLTLDQCSALTNYQQQCSSLNALTQNAVANDIMTAWSNCLQVCRANTQGISPNFDALDNCLQTGQTNSTNSTMVQNNTNTNSTNNNGGNVLIISNIASVLTFVFLFFI